MLIDTMIVSKSGDAHKFHATLGSALAAFVAIEAQLRATFSLSIGFAPLQQHGIVILDPSACSVLAAASGTSGRLALIEAALSAALDGLDEGRMLFDEWRSEQRKLIELERLRQQLLHGTVLEERDLDGRLERMVLQIGEMAPPVTDGHMETWRRRFLAAASRLERFNERLGSNDEMNRRRVARFAQQFGGAGETGKALRIYLHEQLENACN